jgi:hypothetical protein
LHCPSWLTVRPGGISVLPVDDTIMGDDGFTAMTTKAFYTFEASWLQCLHPYFRLPPMQDLDQELNSLPWLLPFDLCLFLSRPSKKPHIPHTQ